jgi:penicillin-binding protein 1A
VWVGFPNETTTLGTSVFGGTIAAPIWEQFMNVAKGSYCGDWPAPREPFEAQSFFGTYAGAHDTGSTNGTNTTPDGTATTPTTTTPTPGGGGTNPNPDAYAHPPQRGPASPPPAPAPSQGGGAAPPSG